MHEKDFTLLWGNELTCLDKGDVIQSACVVEVFMQKYLCYLEPSGEFILLSRALMIKWDGALPGISKVVLVVHSEEKSQLWGFLNFASPVFEAMGGSEKHVASDLQEMEHFIEMCQFFALGDQQQRHDDLPKLPLKGNCVRKPST